jgi:hypothetical protein
MNRNRDHGPATKSPRLSRKLIAILAAGVLVVGAGITAASVGVASTVADETARQCAVALKGGEGSDRATLAAITAANAALERTKSVTLPGNAGTSTDYSARAAVAAVKAVTAIEVGEGVAAVAGVARVPRRASGAEQITGVTDARDALAKIEPALPLSCTDRAQAAWITALAGKATLATETLDASVTALTSDFGAFQADEAVRIAAEIEAARVAAEVEAARVAAEAAAAAEAARAAAAHKPSAGGSSRSGGSTASGAGRGLNGSGSFSVGTPGKSTLPPGVCRVDNGVGGFTTGATGPCN